MKPNCCRVWAASSQQYLWPPVHVLAQHPVGVAKKQGQVSSPVWPYPTEEVRDESQIAIPTAYQEWIHLLLVLGGRKWCVVCTINHSPNVKETRACIQGDQSMRELPKLTFIFAQDCQQERRQRAIDSKGKKTNKKLLLCYPGRFFSYCLFLNPDNAMTMKRWLFSMFSEIQYVSVQSGQKRVVHIFK